MINKNKYLKVIQMLKILKNSAIIISTIIFSLLMMSFFGCQDELPNDKEFTSIVECARDIKNRVAKENEISNVYGSNYKFEIDGDCGYTALNAMYRATIPYRVSNTGGNDIIDIAYYIEGTYIGTEIDYKYKIYLNWSKERQNMFYIARIDTKPDKTYSSKLVTKALNK